MQAHLASIIQHAGGWLPFDRFMHEALYAPGLGYYAASLPKLGISRQDGSDFVTAPERSPLFTAGLVYEWQQAQAAGQGRDVLELGAGSGQLALDFLQECQRRHCLPQLLLHLFAIHRLSHFPGHLWLQQIQYLNL